MVLWPLTAAFLFSLLQLTASSFERDITVYEQTTSTLKPVQAWVVDQGVYLPVPFLVSALQFETKGLAPGLVGMCREDLCIPMSIRVLGRQDHVSVFQLFEALGGKAAWDDGTSQLFLDMSLENTDFLTSSDSIDFTLPDLDNRSVGLSNFRGKKVVLFAWASW